MSINSVLVNDTTSGISWINEIQKTVKNMKERYILLAESQLSGILLVVLIKKKYKKEIQNVETGQVACGIMNVLGNKGGVAVKFTWNNTKINVDNIYDQDLIIWTGDLNYRIRYPSRSEVIKMIKEEEFEELEIYDQLHEQIRLGNVFEGFSESRLRFAPTYKFNNGTSVYDTSEKQRLPAWTDRVLWKTKRKNVEIVNPIFYNSHPEYMTSDHKPVSSLLEIKIWETNNKKFKQFQKDLRNQLDQMEMSLIPQASINTHSIKFGCVYFGLSNDKWLTITNTGKVPFNYFFKRKTNDDPNSIHRPWLTINKQSDLILPGESKEILLTMLIGTKIAPLIYLGKESLNDILILHLDGGKDFFIDISGEYQKSCFGMDFDDLIKIPDPIRFSKPYEYYQDSNNRINDNDNINDDEASDGDEDIMGKNKKEEKQEKVHEKNVNKNKIVKPQLPSIPKRIMETN